MYIAHRLASAKPALVLISVTSSLLVLTGCAGNHGRSSPKPVIQVSAFSHVDSPEAVRPEVSQPWWTGLATPELDGLISAALKNNQTLAAALARLEQAEASYNRSRANQGPTLDAKVKADRDVKAETHRLNRIEYGLTASWELDFFGRLENTKRARGADLQSKKYSLEAARLALTATLADAYFGVIEQRLLLQRLAQQEKTAINYVSIIQSRYDQGLISKVDLLQQQSQLADIRSLVPDAESNLRTQENLVSTLVGASPGTTHPAITDPAFPALPPLPSIGQPDELLKKRPDLRGLQADLMAADADIGRAIADRIPRLVFGMDAVRVAGRSTEDGLVTLTGSLVQPLLDWGARRAEVSRTRGVFSERLALYSQTYLDGVYEVENNVYRESRQKNLLIILDERRQLLQQSFDQAQQRYVAGLTDYLPVLTAVQQLYTVEQRLIREQRRLVSFRIALHRALGGPVQGADSP